MMESESRQIKNDSKNLSSDIYGSEGFRLAIYTILGYLIHFVYQWGYFTKFGLPIEFISYEISDLVSNGIYLIFIAIVGLLYFRLFINTFASKKTPWILLKKYFIIFTNIVCFLILKTTFPSGYDEPYIYLIVTLFSVVNWFIPPLINKKKKGSYLEKMIALEKEKAETKEEHTPLFDSLINNIIPSNLSYYLSILVLVLLFSFNLGKANALKKKRYPILNENPARIVIYIKSDMLIATDIQLNTRKLTGDFHILEFSSSDEIQFSYKNVGPLDFEDDNVIEPFINSLFQ